MVGVGITLNELQSIVRDITIVRVRQFLTLHGLDYQTHRAYTVHSRCARVYVSFSGTKWNLTSLQRSCYASTFGKYSLWSFRRDCTYLTTLLLGHGLFLHNRGRGTYNSEVEFMTIKRTRSLVGSSDAMFGLQNSQSLKLYSLSIVTYHLLVQAGLFTVLRYGCLLTTTEFSFCDEFLVLIVTPPHEIEVRSWLPRFLFWDRNNACYRTVDTHFLDSEVRANRFWVW